MHVHKLTDYVAIFSSDGLGKKVNLNEFVIQGRGGKGNIVSKEKVVGAAMISDEDNILISGNTSSVCISAKDVPLLGRIAAGNIMIKGNKIISITKI